MPLNSVPPFQFENQTIKVQNRNKGGCWANQLLFHLYNKAKVCNERLVTFFLAHSHSFTLKFIEELTASTGLSAYLVNLLMKNTKVVLSNSWKQLFLSRHGETIWTGAEHNLESGETTYGMDLIARNETNVLCLTCNLQHVRGKHAGFKCPTVC